MYCIDLNSDLGESFGTYVLGRDEEVLSSITSANVACGFHAGDPQVMQRTVAAAKTKGVAVGAHPGHPDLQGFGRRETGCEWVGRPEASEIGCFWVRGEATSEFLIETAAPVERVRLALGNGGRPNEVTVRVQGHSERVSLAPGETRELVFATQPGFVYAHKGLTGWVMDASVTSRAGWVPALDGDDGRSGDERFLGVFVHLDVEPVPGRRDE